MQRQGILPVHLASRTCPDTALVLPPDPGSFDCVCRALRPQQTSLRMTGHLISTVSVLVVSFPKISITFTTTVYRPGSKYSRLTESSILGFFRVR
jgi:hypothetical protein